MPETAENKLIAYSEIQALADHLQSEEIQQYAKLEMLKHPIDAHTQANMLSMVSMRLQMMLMPQRREQQPDGIVIEQLQEVFADHIAHYPPSSNGRYILSNVLKKVVSDCELNVDVLTVREVGYVNQEVMRSFVALRELKDRRTLSDSPQDAGVSRDALIKAAEAMIDRQSGMLVKQQRGSHYFLHEDEKAVYAQQIGNLLEGKLSEHEQQRNARLGLTRKPRDPFKPNQNGRYTVDALESIYHYMRDSAGSQAYRTVIADLFKHITHALIEQERAVSSPSP